MTLIDPIVLAIGVAAAVLLAYLVGVVMGRRSGADD